MEDDQKKKVRNGVKLAFVIIALSLSAFLSIQILEISANKFQDNADLNIEKKEIESELSAQILKQDSDYLYYSDRVVKIFKSNQENRETAIEMLRSFLELVPAEVNSTLMLIPGRIAYEKNRDLVSDNPVAEINEINRQIADLVATIDMDAIFRERTDEYIYFRTNEGCTIKGLYYGAEAYLEKQGTPIISLDEYNERIISNFLGIYYSFEKNSIDQANGDSIYYYIHPEKTNWAKITAKVTTELYESYEAPTVALSRKGTDIFVAGNYSHAVLKGDGNNGKTLLLVGDSQAKMLATWMSPYYQNVYLINADFYQGSREEFLSIFNQYNVSEMIFAEELFTFENKLRNTKIRKLIQSQ